MYSMVQLEHVDGQALEDRAPTRLPVGTELDTENLATSVWSYEKGEENVFHRHERQEELYTVLEGTIDLTLEYGEQRDVIELRAGDFVRVPPETWRQFQARSSAVVLAVGAPNVDDGVLET